MNKILYLIIPFLFLEVIASCSKNPVSPETNREEIQYYVRYASDGLSISGYYVNYTNEEGKNVHLSNQSAETFERTIGPVSKGFKASFSIKGDYFLPTIRIEVKEGNNPFVVKAEKTAGVPSVGASISYTIE